MNAAPPIEVLESLVAPDKDRGMPLYVQVRRAMRQVIDEHFEDGQQFWTEQALIERLSVSQITVRRALNDLAKDGFLMRRAAKGTFVRKPAHDVEALYRVGVFVPKYNSDILSSVLENIANVCHERKQRMDIYYIHQGQRVADVLGALEHKPESQRFVLLGQPKAANAELADLLEQRGYRFVTVDSTHMSDDFDVVGYDDQQGVDIAVRYLHSLGHTQISLVLSEIETADPIIYRRRAFDAIVDTLGIEGRVVSTGVRYWESAHDATYAAMPRLWNEGQRPTAVLTVSDAGAWAAMRWFSENGIRVPSEVSVMGFDDDRLSRYTHPSLTTLGRDRAALAKSALDLLAGPLGPSHANVWIPAHLVKRESTGPSPASPSKTKLTPELLQTR